MLEPGLPNEGTCSQQPQDSKQHQRQIEPELCNIIIKAVFESLFQFHVHFKLHSLFIHASPVITVSLPVLIRGVLDSGMMPNCRISKQRTITVL